MQKRSTRKIGLEMNARLYSKLSRVAKANGQSRRYLLEKALEEYLDQLAPTQSDVRPETLKQLKQSIKKNRKLYELLAQSSRFAK